MNDSSKSIYIKYCEQENDLPIFMQPWWLDVTCGVDSWDVALDLEKGQIAAALPYKTVSKWRTLQIQVPLLTPFLGPWIAPSSKKASELFCEERETLLRLIDQLPTAVKYFHKLRPEISNCLPFVWKGYSQTTAYTYRLSSLENLDSVWNNFRSSARREIRKAEKRYKLTVSEDRPFDEFYNVYKKTFVRQNLTPKISRKEFSEIDAVCKNNSASTILTAIDPEGEAHAVMYLLHDSHCTYYLAGGGDPDLRNSGAASLIIWYAIRSASAKKHIFDFEGSMIQPIEKFFSTFGATQTPYHCVSKVNSKLLRLLLALRNH